MNYADEFMPEDWFLLVSLPVRVGAWMARQDDVGVTRKDNIRETQSLIAILTHFTKAQKNAPLSSQLATAALLGRGEWQKWVQGDEHVVADIPRAIKIIQHTISESDVRDFRGMLWRIARVVASAYDEDNGVGDDLSNESLFGAFITGMMERMESAMPEDIEHISDKERQGLKELRQAILLFRP